MRTLLTVLTIFAVAMFIATTPIQPVHGREGDNPCDRGAQSRLCGVVPP